MTTDRRRRRPARPNAHRYVCQTRTAIVRPSTRRLIRFSHGLRTSPSAVRGNRDRGTRTHMSSSSFSK